MKTKAISKKIVAVRESLFIRSLKLAKSNPSKVGFMVLFDALFLVSIYALQTITNYFAQSLFVPQNITLALTYLFLSLIYYLIILLVYSFFKYIILDYIKSLFEITEFSFKRIGQFYSLNIVIAGLFFAIMFLFNMMLVGIKQPYAPFVFIFLAIPYLLALYLVVNISHSLFYQGSSLKETIKKGFKMTFTKISFYKDIILIMILFALLLWLLFFGSGYLIRLIASKNYSMYLSIYAYFKQISIIVFDIVFYLVILINRISFYSIIRESK